MSGEEQLNNGGGIPLTTWINSALNSINTTSSQSPSSNQPQTASNKINSTLYTSAALNIAQSLICQLNLAYAISGTVNDEQRQELILPNDISNWSNSIVIHLNTEEQQQQGEEPIVNISRAEFTTPSQNSQQQQLKCLSRDENKHIYSLGIVLYQLFSGNQAPPLEKEVLDKLVMNAQLKIKEAYEKLSESERVRLLFVCFIYDLLLKLRNGDIFGI